MATVRRPMQDFTTFLSFGTQTFWDQVKANPTMCPELFAGLLCRLQLKTASETTCAVGASAIAVAMYRKDTLFYVPQTEIDNIYTNLKVMSCMPAST